MTSENMDDTAQPLLAHLIELRARLLWSVGGFFVAFLVCFFFAKQLFNLLVVPFTWAVQWAGLDGRQIELIYTAPQEFFFTQIKIAMFGGLIIAFPLIAAQIYKFVAPGLYKNERSAFLPFLIASPLLFLLGAALAVEWASRIPQEGSNVAIELLPKVSEYLDLIMTLIFAFGLVFQLPVVTTLLARAGLVSAKGLADKRKYAIVAAFIAAAILTPPDPASQIGLALPTILLYEIAIYAARIVERQRAERKAREDLDGDGDGDPESGDEGESSETPSP